LPVLAGTITIPYGLMSPLAGTVEPTVEIFVRPERNELAAGVAVGYAALFGAT
jgi:hypothetical protein